ncbi:MAG: 23S rRNA (adenine(2503)-C(2))-methyltransferase RlmN [Bacillota bacterium]
MPPLLGQSYEELVRLMEEHGQPAYRARQIMDWLYRRGVAGLEEMTNLPRNLRQTLAAEGYEVGLPQEKARREGADGTKKFLFGLADGETIETVYIPEGPRRTVCVSTQVGCGMGCAFCATGQGGLVRNLAAGEIVGQVLAVRRAVGLRITNVVAMGQGEPLANYEATVKAFRLMGVEHGMGIAARHLTISTCGLPPGILRLAEEGRQWQLTVSLHAVRDDLRDRLMPINRRYPLAVLREACLEYSLRTGRRITFAYVVIPGVNDEERDAAGLVGFCRGMTVHINLIPWNPVPGVAFRAPSAVEMERFRRRLAAAGLNVTVRRTRGVEFKAACGQLRAEELEGLR